MCVYEFMVVLTCVSYLKHDFEEAAYKLLRSGIRDLAFFTPSESQFQGLKSLASPTVMGGGASCYNICWLDYN